MIPLTYDQVSRIDRLIRNNKLGVIYLVADTPAGPVKIGKSTFLSVRLDSLQTGNPCKLHVFAAFLVSHRKAHDWERLIHRELAASRLRGEWFALSTAEAKSACRTAMRSGLAPPSEKASDVPAGQSAKKTPKPTSHTALKAVYRKRILEWSRRTSPEASPQLSPYLRARNDL